MASNLPPQKREVVFTLQQALEHAEGALKKGRLEEAIDLSRQIVKKATTSGHARNILRRAQRRLYDLHNNGPHVQQHCGLERFVFSDETGQLTDAEYQIALAQLKHVADTLRERGQSDAGNPNIGGESVWNSASPSRWQIDGGPTNHYVLYELARSGDREVLQKLRLYSPFSGYILPTLSFSEARPWVSEKLPANWDACLKLLVPRTDMGFQKYMMVRDEAPKRLPQSLPAKFGEIGWLVDGAIANFDTAYYLEKLVMMHEAGVLEPLGTAGVKTVVEIGGGFGGLAYMLQAAQGNLRYIIVDLPEMLAFSAIYLSVLFSGMKNRFITRAEEFQIDEEPGFTFVPSFLHRELRTRASCSLAINTASFAEMGESQVDEYGDTIASILGEKGLLWEQNMGTDAIHCKAVDVERVLGKHLAIAGRPIGSVTDLALPAPPRIWKIKSP